MQEDAREVAKATGVDFGDDAVGAIMKKYDTNGTTREPPSPDPPHAPQLM